MISTTVAFTDLGCIVGNHVTKVMELSWLKGRTGPIARLIPSVCL